MRTVLVNVAVLAILGSASPGTCNAKAKYPNPSFTLHIPGVRFAEMSPNEKEVALIIMRGDLAKGPVSKELQIWDYRSGTLLWSHDLPFVESRADYYAEGVPLAYTRDGELLAVRAGGNLLQVWRSAAMSELRTVQIEPNARINAMEASPRSHQLALRMPNEIVIIDLDSGQEVRRWKISDLATFPPRRLLFPRHPQFDASGLAWGEDGSVLAISIADDQPCLSGGGAIVLLDPAANEPRRSFRVPTLPSSIAFGSGANLYVTSNTCGGYFAHWALDLPIFDTTTGREIGKIPAGYLGFRGQISISSDRRYLLAHADREKTTFFEELEDTLVIVSEEWQVWDLSSKQIVLRLPRTERNLSGLSPALSQLGHFVYALRGEDLLVFDVPQND